MHIVNNTKIHLVAGFNTTGEENYHLPFPLEPSLTAICWGNGWFVNTLFSRIILRKTYYKYCV